MSEKKVEGEKVGAEVGGKFILLYVSNEDSKEMIKHVMEDTGMERGVFLKSDITNKIVDQFDFLKDNGYFPNAMILSRGSDLVEFTFRRHPNQDPSKKLVELAKEDKFQL